MRDALLAVLGALALTWAGSPVESAGAPNAINHCLRECTTFLSKPIPLHLLQSYEKTTCGKPSVILTTMKNLTFCARPGDKWVQKVMSELDAKNAPPTSNVVMSEKPPVLGSTVRMSTLGMASRPAHSTAKFNTPTYGMTTFSVLRTGDPTPSVVNSMTPGPEVAKFPTESTPKPEVVVAGATVHPETSANGSTLSTITDETETFREDVTSVEKGLEDITESVNDSMVHPTILGTPATSIYSGFDSKKPMGSLTQLTHYQSSTSSSRPVTESTTKDMKLTRLLASSNLQGSILSTHRTDTGPQSTMSLTTVPLRNIFSSTPSNSGAGKLSSVSVTDRGDVVSDSAIAFGGVSKTPLSTEATRDSFSKSSSTLPNSRFHQENFHEKSRAEASGPVLPTVLAEYRTHAFSFTVVGVLCTSFAVALAYMKHSFRARSSSKEMVQGLLFSQFHSQTDTCALEML